MNSITALKLAGISDLTLGQAVHGVSRGVRGVFGTSADLGGELGRVVGSEDLGRLAGYVAPILGANYVANQFAPTRRAKVWLANQVQTSSPVLGQALMPKDYGARPGDYGNY